MCTCFTVCSFKAQWTAADVGFPIITNWVAGATVQACVIVAEIIYQLRQQLFVQNRKYTSLVRDTAKFLYALNYGARVTHPMYLIHSTLHWSLVGRSRCSQRQNQLSHYGGRCHRSGTDSCHKCLAMQKIVLKETNVSIYDALYKRKIVLFTGGKQFKLLKLFTYS